MMLKAREEAIARERARFERHLEREATPGTFEAFLKRHSELRAEAVKRAGAPLIDYFDALIADHEWSFS